VLALPGAARPAAQAAKPGTLTLTIRSEQGLVLSGAVVAVHGLVDRRGTSGADGVVMLQNLPAGTYRARITRDGYITLDKDVAIRAGSRTTGEGVLAPAPTPSAPPPAPTPTPLPVDKRSTTPASTVKPGMARVMSLPDLVEQMLKQPQPIVEHEIGCSVATVARLILARESVAMHRHSDADEVLYMVAGEATLTMTEKDQNVTAGWFGLVPRGTSHSLIRRGRNPMVVLSVQSGEPCPK
jgi:mannose-6-phosphate isomerase-like protein (cupin superfamily)